MSKDDHFLLMLPRIIVLVYIKSQQSLKLNQSLETRLSLN
jgi:hypothetical protein